MTIFGEGKDVCTEIINWLDEFGGVYNQDKLFEMLRIVYHFKCQEVCDGLNKLCDEHKIVRAHGNVYTRKLYD